MAGFGSSPFIAAGTCYADQDSFWQAVVNYAKISYPTPPHDYTRFNVSTWPAAGPNFGKPYYKLYGHLNGSPTESVLTGFYLNTCNVASPVALPLSSETVSLLAGGTWPVSSPVSASLVDKAAISAGFNSYADTVHDLVGFSLYFLLFLFAVLMAMPFVKKIIRQGMS